MSEKNGEIARELYEQIEDMTSAPIPVDCKKIIHEALDTKDREYEAVIGVLVGALDFYASGFYETGYDHTIQSTRALKEDKGKTAQEALSHPLVQEYLKKEKI